MHIQKMGKLLIEDPELKEAIKKSLRLNKKDEEQRSISILRQKISENKK
jgi:hypothetical protein